MLCVKFIIYIGLILNIIGTLLVSFSFGTNLGEAHQIDDKGRKIYLASFLHPGWFKSGITLLVIGFFMQLVFALISP